MSVLARSPKGFSQDRQHHLQAPSPAAARSPQMSIANGSLRLTTTLGLRRTAKSAPWDRNNKTRVVMAHSAVSTQSQHRTSQVLSYTLPPGWVSVLGRPRHLPCSQPHAFLKASHRDVAPRGQGNRQGCGMTTPCQSHLSYSPPDQGLWASTPHPRCPSGEPSAPSSQSPE